MKIKVWGFYTSKCSVEFEDVTKQIYSAKTKSSQELQLCQLYKCHAISRKMYVIIMAISPIFKFVYAAQQLNAYTVVKSVAVSECHLVTVTKMYSNSHYLPQISLPFHQVFLQCI